VLIRSPFEKKSKILQNGCSFFSKIAEKNTGKGNTRQQVDPKKKREEYRALASLDSAEKRHVNDPGR